MALRFTARPFGSAASVCCCHQQSSSGSKMTQAGVVPMPEVHRFVVDCLEAVGAKEAAAQAMAELLTAADYRGHFSHGLNRLEMYVNDIKQGSCDANAEPSVLKSNAATAWVDGRNGLGPVVGNFCMKLAIEKAKKSGVGWVVAKNSNHYGIAAWYSMQAVKSGLVGLTCTNTSPLMSPTRSKTAALGTNPLSVAAPAADGDSFVLDMATTAVALGKIEVQRRKNEPIPEGWAQGPDGKPTTDAEVGFNTGCLMPLGGAEEFSGYKGYGLGTMVEVLCGIMAGAHYGPNVRSWVGHNNEPANLGQCFVAVDPSCFAPGFEDRLSDLLLSLRNMEPADPEKPVRVAGDPEKLYMQCVDRDSGVRYHENQLKALAVLANKLNVKPLGAA